VADSSTVPEPPTLRPSVRVDPTADGNVTLPAGVGVVILSVS